MVYYLEPRDTFFALLNGKPHHHKPGYTLVFSNLNEADH